MVDSVARNDAARTRATAVLNLYMTDKKTRATHDNKSGGRIRARKTRRGMGKRRESGERDSSEQVRAREQLRLLCLLVAV